MTMITTDVDWFNSFIVAQITFSWIAGFLGVILYKFTFFIFCYERKLASKVRCREGGK